jgi:hypothetical protein
MIFTLVETMRYSSTRPRSVCLKFEQIRIFGDPKSQGRETPVQTIRCSVEIQLPTALCVREASQDVICDFVNGIAFGDALGIGIRSISGWWTVTNVAVKNTEARVILTPPEQHS